MHFGDYTFIFLLALVLFGPKKLPEIGKQLGKLLAEFRRASNEFKFQIQEELRNMEEEERRKKLAEQQAALTATTLAAEPAKEAAPESPSTPTILPPSTGATVSTGRPYAPSADAPDLAAEAGAQPAAEPADAAAPPAEEHESSAPPPEASVSHPAEGNSENVSLAGVESGAPGTHHA